MKLGETPQAIRNVFILFFLFSFSFFLAQKPEAAPKSFHYVKLNGEISPGMAAYLKRAFSEVEAEGSGGVILGIDTYGGRVDSAIKITELVESLDPIPVYAYIEDKAWSAGALISLATNMIFMEGGSSIGSAAPVVAGGGGKAEELGEKHVSAIRTKFEALAEKHGHSIEIAAAMVDKDIEVLKVKMGEHEKIMTRTDYDNLSEKEQKKRKILETISAKGKLLNLTAEKAKKYGLAEGVYKNPSAVFTSLQAEPGNIKNIEQSGFEKFVGLITSATVSSLLLSLGFLLIYLEFQAPGMSWAGITGLICLGLVFGGHYLIEYAEKLELVLFMIGVVLVLLELFVIPGFGVPGLVGILCIIASIYLALVPFGVPKAPWEFSMMKNAMLITLGSMVGAMFGGLIVLANIHRIPLLNKLVLTATLGHEKNAAARKRPFRRLSVGDKGVAASSLRPVGKGRFGTALHDVVSESGIIAPDTKIEIVNVKEYEYVVKPVKVKE